jgi:polyisoprenyl-phosphate glycosyltransferase
MKKAQKPHRDEEPLVSVVIPVYKSEPLLRDLCDRTVRVLEQYTRGRFEIIFVNDNSPDDAWSVLIKFRQMDSRVGIIRLMRNVGQHNATLCGLRYARGAYVVMMDDDLQNPPEEIPKLIDHLVDNGLDAVFGIPIEKKHSAPRRLGSRLNNMILNISIKKPCDLRLSSFRVITSAVRSAVAQYRGEYVTIGGLICLIAGRSGNVIVEHHARKTGISGYSLSKLIKLSLNNLINFSLFPLRVISYIGFLSFSFAFVYAVFIVVQKMRGAITSAGFATMAILTCFFSGLILLSIGIVGEYIMKVIKGAYSLPQYTIREALVDVKAVGKGA